MSSHDYLESSQFKMASFTLIKCAYLLAGDSFIPKVCNVNIPMVSGKQQVESIGSFNWFFVRQNGHF